MPEHTEPSLLLFQLLHRPNGIIHTQVLMIFRHQFPQSAHSFLEDDKIFNNIHEPYFFTSTPNQRIQRNDSHLAFIIDLFPIGKMLKICHGAAYFRLAAIGQDDEHIVPE